MKRRRYLPTASLVLLGCLTAYPSVSQSIIDLNAGKRSGRVQGSVLDLDRPPEIQRAPSDNDQRRAASLPATRVAGRPEVEALVLDVGIEYTGHRALRTVGLSGQQWLAFFRANIAIESAFNPRARSHVGAIGLGQLMPETARVLGVNPHDPKQNLHGSARYLLQQLERFGSLELALAAYNAGPEAVAEHSGIPPYRETQGHVRKVMAIYQASLGEST